MNQEIIPCVFFPTTVVFVDDDKQFLDRMSLTFGRQWPLLLFNSPEEALKFLKEKYHSNPFTNRCIHEPIDQDPDKRDVEINIRTIREEIYNPLRYGEITVVVLDYKMPGLTGGELAELLKMLPFKIILLTGVADQQEAVKLFNQGIIHQYIQKNDLNLDTILAEAITELQQGYFQELSLPILNSLAKSPDFPHIWFKEPEIRKLLFRLCKENNVVEYVLSDELGSYLLLTKEAKPSWLAIKNDKEIEGLIAHAEFEDAPPEAVINALKSRKYIPYFHTDKDLQTPPANWDKYFHPATKLQGKDTYYYAYITDPNAYDIQPDKVMSYQKYLQKNAK